VGTDSLSILDRVNLDVYEGEFLAIMGASGSGKTTLLNIIGFLDRPSSGSYLYKGQNIESLSDDQLSGMRKNEVAFVFQSFNLIHGLTVLENVELPMVYQKVQHQKRREIVLSMLDRVGLKGKSQRIPLELSGGEQQRVAIARALIANPTLLLADEPTGNLDSKTGIEIMEILKSLNATGITIIMVTHAKEMTEHADRTIHIKDGWILNGAEQL
jgi:putative ABC transport system ATP-binding protein